MQDREEGEGGVMSGSGGWKMVLSPFDSLMLKELIWFHSTGGGPVEEQRQMQMKRG